MEVGQGPIGGCSAIGKKRKKEKKIFVKNTMNPWVPCKAGNFLTVTFSGRSLLHGVGLFVCLLDAGR
jgi:hypothetical protein